MDRNKKKNKNKTLNPPVKKIQQKNMTSTCVLCDGPAP